LIETDIAWHAALPDWVPVTEVLGTTELVASSASKQSDAAKVSKTVGSKKTLFAVVTTLAVLGAAAVVLVPKYLVGDGGLAERGTPNTPKPKVAGSINSNPTPDGIANNIGDTNAPAGNTLSVPLAPNGPSDTSFAAVTQHLDTGGSFYFYLSTDEAQGWVRSGFDEGGKLLEQFGPMLGEEGEGQAAMALTAAKALYAGIGLDAIDGLGASTRSFGDGLKRNVAMLHRDPAKSDGILWKAFGGAAHDLDGLSLMPPDTVYAFHGDLDLAAILAWAKTMAANNLPPEATLPLDEMLAQPQVQQILAAYGGEVGAYVTLDFQKMHKLIVPDVEATLPGDAPAVPGIESAIPSGVPAVPGGLPALPGEEGVVMEIPEPGLVLTIKVKNGDLLAMLQEVAESMGMTLAEVDLGGVKAFQFPQPIPFPPLPEMNVQPVVFQSGGYLILTSSPALAAKVIATQADPDTGLRGTAEFAKLTKGMELKGNQFTFMSSRVEGLYGKIIKQGMAAEAAMLPESVQNLVVRLMTLGMSGQVTVLKVLPEGFLVRTHTEGMGYDTAVLAVGAVVPVAVIGTAAAVALPAVQGARQNAREAQSANNVRQLAIAIHTFHADNDQLPDAAKWSDALLPFVGNDKQIFISPTDPDADGSSYAFNKNLSGVKLETLRAAARTVVFFESDLGWNGAGDRDDAFTFNENYLIGFADGHVERVPEEDLDKLNWTP
jgi:type II secretory pathway pseudopilin PulG